MDLAAEALLAASVYSNYNDTNENNYSRRDNARNCRKNIAVAVLTASAREESLTAPCTCVATCEKAVLTSCALAQVRSGQTSKLNLQASVEGSSNLACSDGRGGVHCLSTTGGGRWCALHSLACSCCSKVGAGEI